MSFVELKVGTTYRNCKNHMVTIHSAIVPYVNGVRQEQDRYFIGSDLQHYDGFGYPIDRNTTAVVDCLCRLKEFGES